MFPQWLSKSSQCLKKQDGLYHTNLKGIKNGILTSETKLITCIREIVNPYKEWECYLKLAENPHIKFVISNTTESGIAYNPYDKFDITPAGQFPAGRFAFASGRAEGQRLIGRILQPGTVRLRQRGRSRSPARRRLPAPGKNPNIFTPQTIDRDADQHFPRVK